MKLARSVVNADHQRIRLFFRFAVLIGIATVPARTVVFRGDTTVFRNPERGFYFSINPVEAGGREWPHPPFTEEQLRGYRESYEKMSVVFDRILLKDFVGKNLSQGFLDSLERNFATIRAAGMKCAIRLLYNWGDENIIDAPEEDMVRHLTQLRPVFGRNVDVILFFQGGMFGGCGEAINSSYGHVKAELPQLLEPSGIRIYRKLVEVVPSERMVDLRFPRYKWQMLGWADGENPPDSSVTFQMAYDGSTASRLGFGNQGFLGDTGSYAFCEYGPVELEFSYTAKETRFVAMDGEPSKANAFNKVAGRVLIHCAQHHWTCMTKNQGDVSELFSFWRTTGDYDALCKRLGYRFRLIDATIPDSVRPGGVCTVRLRMANDGFARPVNPRGIELILRNITGNRKYVLAVDERLTGTRENRLWLPGPGEEKSLTVTGGIPTNMPPGRYLVSLSLPDTCSRLYARPEYHIRLASVGVWDSASGYNSLLHEIEISPQASGSLYAGTHYFVAPDTATGVRSHRNGSAASPTEFGIRVDAVRKSILLQRRGPTASATSASVYDIRGRQLSRNSLAQAATTIRMECGTGSGGRSRTYTAMPFY